MEAQENQIALPLRSHTILGICESIRENIGLHPLLLRVASAATVLYSPLLSIGFYLALGVVVLASRLLFPKAVSANAAASSDRPSAANEQREFAEAA